MKAMAELIENPNEGLMKFPGFFSIKRNKGSVTWTSKTSFYILVVVFLKRAQSRTWGVGLGKWITKFVP